MVASSRAAMIGGTTRSSTSTDHLGTSTQRDTEAANALIARLMEDRRDLNFLIFPILFLYRQYLELSLKGLIKDAEDLLGLEREAPTQHHLDRLWDCAKLLLVELLDGEARPEFAVVDNCIEQYSEVDPASTAERKFDDVFSCGGLQRSLLAA